MLLTSGFANGQGGRMPGEMMKQVRSEWVVNYEQEADIQVLSGDLYLDALKPCLPSCYERYLATIYFNRNGENLARQEADILATWFFRAALAHFQGILDLVRADIIPTCKQIWERSEIKANLDSHELVHTMTRVRSIALHTGKLKCSMGNREITFLPGGVKGVRQLMLDPIGSDHFERKDSVAPETIAWFNRQATMWSAHELLEESCFILMTALENFVRINSEQIGQPKAGVERSKRAEGQFFTFPKPKHRPFVY